MQKYTAPYFFAKGSQNLLETSKRQVYIKLWKRTTLNDLKMFDDINLSFVLLCKFVKMHVFCMFPDEIRIKELTWVGGADCSSAREVTGCLSLSIFLEIAIGSIRTVRKNSIGARTTPSCFSRCAIGTSSTCIVYGFLKIRGTLVWPAHTPDRICANIWKKKEDSISFFLKIF